MLSVISRVTHTGLYFPHMAGLISIRFQKENLFSMCVHRINRYFRDGGMAWCGVVWCARVCCVCVFVCVLCVCVNKSLRLQYK